MYRLFAIVLTVYFVFATVVAQTRDAGSVREAAATPAIQTATVMVEGLSADDLLNIRAAASPVGKVMDRIPNGTMLRRLECEKVNGYEWCRIEGLEEEGLSGWTPARYLRTIEIEDRVTAAIGAEGPDEKSPAAAGGEAAAESPKPAASALEERFAGATAAPLREATEARLAYLKQRAETAGLGGSTALPPAADGETEHASVPIPTPRPARPGEEAQAAAAAPVEVQVAARLDSLPDVASAALLRPAETPAAPPSPAPDAADTAAAGTAAPDGDSPEQAAEAAPGVPVPSPRPGRPWFFAAAEPVQAAAEEPAGESAEPAAPPAVETVMAVAAPLMLQSPMPAARDIVVAQSEPAPRQTPATPGVSGEIPCARYVGQPMTRCAVGTTHTGDGAADVAVYWPDGGSRIIEFREGQPARSNSRGEFRFTREGNLNLIRIGLSERFEITDAVVFGD